MGATSPSYFMPSTEQAILLCVRFLSNKIPTDQSEIIARLCTCEKKTSTKIVKNSTKIHVPQGMDVCTRVN